MPGEGCLPDGICQVKPERRKQLSVGFDGTRREMSQDPQFTVPGTSSPEVKPTEATYWERHSIDTSLKIQH